jgi:serine/threonine protein kinase
MGFGIASRLPPKRSSVDVPEVCEGTFAYMAPEQTGRMNRSIDSRSDLYSFAESGHSPARSVHGGEI